MYPCVFHCDFSLHTQFHSDISNVSLGISLGFFIAWHFIGIFHYIPRALHWDFSLHTQCISLRYFKCIHGYFIVIFHYIQGTSLQYFKSIPGYFIEISLHTKVHFIADFLNIALDISLHFSYGCLAFNDYFILSSRIFHYYKNSQKMRIRMVYRISGTAFRVYCIFKKGNIIGYDQKSRRNEDKDDDTCKGPCNGCWEVWSHDQFPKMVKNKSCSP